MATTETFVHGRLYQMPLAELQPDPNQPRKYIDPAALDELIESVKQQGVVTPILFRMEGCIAYVIAGERRRIDLPDPLVKPVSPDDPGRVPQEPRRPQTCADRDRRPADTKGVSRG
jgi:hypothetical protein